METTPDEPNTRRLIYFQHTPTLPRFFRRLFSWRTIRRTLMVAACLATLAAIFYTVELWRGQRAWKTVKRELEAKGEVLDWSAYIPPPVPDDQNIFAAPHIQQWFALHAANQKREDQPRFISQRSDYPGYASKESGSALVAEITVIRPGESPAQGESNLVLRLVDTKAPKLAGKLVQEIVGPMINNDFEDYFGSKLPGQIKPAHFWLEADRPPGTNELTALFSEIKAVALASEAAMQQNPFWIHFYIIPAENNGFKLLLRLQRIFPAADFLAWSDRFQSEFDLLRAALERPYARMEGNYENSFQFPTGGYGMTRDLAMLLSQRAKCYLVLGQPEKALQELTLIHNLRRLLKGKPVTGWAITMNNAICGQYASTLAEGLQLHAWREPQLAVLQEQLKEVNLMPSLTERFRVQHAAGCRFLETVKPANLSSFIIENRRGDYHYYPKLREWAWRRLFSLLPRGWIYQNMAVYSCWISKTIEDLNSTNGIVLPDKADAAWKAMRTLKRSSPYTFLTELTIPNFGIVGYTAEHQILAREALIACALERYYLANGEYPDNLDALSPKYADKIPPDPILGGPFHYRRKSDGTFLLYSIGWNQVDDGGMAVLRENGEPDLNKGDLVWPAKMY